MKLTAKLMFVLLGVIIIGMAVNSYLRVQREVKFFDWDMERDGYTLGYAIRNVVAGVWDLAGKERALALISGANSEGQQIRCRWVWVDAPDDDADAPRLAAASLAPLAQGEGVSAKVEHGPYGGYRYTYVPLRISGDRLGAVEISEPLSQIKEYTHTTIIRTIVTATLMVVYIACSMIVFGIWLVGRPLHQLTEKAKRARRGDLALPVFIPGRDELSELAASMNTMCDTCIADQKKLAAETAARMEALEQLRHADRLKTVGRLASGIAHELGTPLNVVSGRAGLIEAGGLAPDEIVSNAGIIRTQSERIATLVRRLLDFARRQPPEKATVDLRQVTARTMEFVRSLAEKQNAALCVVDGDGPMLVKGDAGQIDQALTNIVMNALQAMPQGGRVQLALRREHVRPPQDSEALEGEYVCLSVEDEGEGIAAENLPHIFEPFFTTKSVGQGTGLGLSIAHGIIREHGGWIGVTSQVGQGSRFSIYLPRGSD